MEIIKCSICNVEMSEDKGLRTHWNDEYEILCESCYDSEEEAYYDYLYDMNYACPNGCCACCGCSCDYYGEYDYDDEYYDDTVEDTDD